MDDARFDALVRRVGAAVMDRRHAAAAGAGVAVLLLPGAAVAAPVTADACRGFKAKCRRKKECCSGVCRRKSGGKRRCACAPEGARCAETADCCSDVRALYCASGFCVRKR
ncbi:MAG: hypothetical protein U0Z70_13415 [Thermomicrobiales bacterium]